MATVGGSPYRERGAPPSSLDPGTADHRSPGRYLWWLMKGQWHTLLLGMLFGIVWMVCQAVMPAVIGHAIDDGIAAQDTDSLVHWTLAMFGIGVLQAASGIMRHRFAVTNWLTAAYRTVQLVTRTPPTSAQRCRSGSPPVRSSPSAPTTCPTSATRWT